MAGTPIIPITVIGKETVSMEGILDTGFDGFLCLPIAIAVSLGLELTKVVRTELANGTIVEDELVFSGKADWDGTVLRGFSVQLNYED